MRNGADKQHFIYEMKNVHVYDGLYAYSAICDDGFVGWNTVR